MSGKLELSVPQTLNMSVGYLGIQFAFELQNANVRRIFQMVELLLEALIDGHAVCEPVLGGVSLLLAGLCMLRIAEPEASVLATAPAPQA